MLFRLRSIIIRSLILTGSRRPLTRALDDATQRLHEERTLCDDPVGNFLLQKNKNPQPERTNQG